MSQIKFTCPNTRQQVVCGWDRMTQTCHLTVYGHALTEDGENEIVYYELCGGTSGIKPMKMYPTVIITVLKNLKVHMPRELLRTLQDHVGWDLGNEIVEFTAKDPLE